MGLNEKFFASSSCNPSTTGLQLFLDASDTNSYSGTGSTWYDLSGNNDDYTGNNMDGTDWNSDGYFSFNGTNESFTNNNISLNTQQPFSFCGWVYPTVDSTWQRLFSWGTSGTEVIIQKRGDSNKARFIGRISSSVKFDVDGAVLTSNQWHFIAVTGNGSNVNMYVNDETAVTDSIDGTNTYNNSQLATGAGTSEYFTGRISKFRLYNIALTEAEIEVLYCAGR